MYSIPDIKVIIWSTINTLNFKFSAAVADVICHALVLTRHVISVNCDGNKRVDIVS